MVLRANPEELFQKIQPSQPQTQTQTIEYKTYPVYQYVYTFPLNYIIGLVTLGAVLILIGVIVGALIAKKLD